jgi:lipopolysaccharide biosynthesis glycosyltransferase
MEKKQRREEGAVVVYAADENVAIGLYVSVFSLLCNLPKRTHCRVYVVDGGISDRTKEKIEILFLNCISEIYFIEAPLQRISGLPTPRSFGRGAYLSLLVPELMSGLSDKVVFLDADTIILKNICTLYSANINDCIAGAVKEFVEPTLKHTVKTTGLLNIVGLDPDRAYINSGVMVIDVKEWCRARVTERSIQLLTEHSDVLSVVDQDALNGTIEKWAVLDPRWNVQLHWLIESQGYGRKKSLKIDSLENVNSEKDLLESPGILHFNDQPKPWQRGYVGPYQELYFEYLSLSGWFRDAYRWAYRVDMSITRKAHKAYIMYAKEIRPRIRYLKHKFLGGS